MSQGEIDARTQVSILYEVSSYSDVAPVADISIGGRVSILYEVSSYSDAYLELYPTLFQSSTRLAAIPTLIRKEALDLDEFQSSTRLAAIPTGGAVSTPRWRPFLSFNPLRG